MKKPFSPLPTTASPSATTAVVPPASLHYYVFAADRQVYGPANLSLLQDWIAQGLIDGESWVYDEGNDVWRRVKSIKELRSSLQSPIALKEDESDVSPAHLRRIRLFSDMDDHQLKEILSYLKKVSIPAMQPVARKGAHSTSMHLLLSGEASMFTIVDGMQKGLATIQVGDFFGESTLIEEGPCPFDINTTQECVFLRLRHSDFQDMLCKQPDLAARFLTALVRHLSYNNIATRDRFAKAKALVRGSLARTGKIVVPDFKFKR
ncbi:MAG: cyclic nucleotide-binding domain-containing protein [Verrucomicrobiae bacterium]|nr:cyclic nucleotide-binding domain-containing protein [Verrucomicrobiae bacterium]